MANTWIMFLFLFVVGEQSPVIDEIKLDTPFPTEKQWSLLKEVSEGRARTSVTLDKLAQLLDHPNGLVRDRVARIIALKGKDAVSILLSVVNDERSSFDKKRGAVHAFGCIGPPAFEATPHLICIFDLKGGENDQYFLRTATRDALALIGPKTVPQLAAYLDRCENEQGILLALESLSKIGTKSLPSLSSVTAKMEHRSPEVRRAAAHSLLLMETNAPEVCDAYRRFLIKFVRDRGRVNEWTESRACLSVLEHIQQLGKNGDGLLDPILLLANAPNLNEEVKSAAYSAIATLRPNQKCLATVLNGLKDERSNVRLAALRAVEPLISDSKLACEQVVVMIDDKSSKISLVACTLLLSKQIKSERALAKLQAHLHSSEIELRIASAKLLVRDIDRRRRAILALVQIAENDEAHFRIAALLTIWEYAEGASWCLPKLKTLLSDVPNDIVFTLPLSGAILRIDASDRLAVETMKKNLSKMETIMELGTSPNNLVCWRICVDIIGRTGLSTPSIIKALEVALKDENPVVSQDAARALEGIRKK